MKRKREMHMKQKLQQFMAGRYGVDQLSKIYLGITFVLLIVARKRQMERMMKLVTMCHALGDNGRVSTEEIDPDILGSAVEGLGDGDIVSRDMAARRADKGDGGDGDALVDNGDGKLARDGLACLHKVAGEGRYAGVYVLARLLERAVSAREEGYAHGYRADIKILLLYHLVGL